MDYYNRRAALVDSLRELKGFVQKKNWEHKWNFEQKLVAQSHIILITDTSQKIEFASANLVEMNGYEPEEVLGKSPKMFQGADTSAETRQQIREALIKQIPYSGSILNYRKNGTTYNCLVEEYPVWNKTGKLVNFIAFEKVA